MSGVGDVIDWGADFIRQSAFDVGKPIVGVGNVPLALGEEPNKRKKRKAGETSVKEKKAARGRIKPIPDAQSKRTEMRKKSSRERANRGGRVSTLLSSRETLG